MREVVLTMLLVCLVPNALRAENLLYLGKQLQLLVVMVALDEAKPRLRVADEFGLVLVRYVRSLLVYRVVAAENRIVDMRHVRCTQREDIGLTALS